MSVVIGYSCERFSLIATDTRIVNGDSTTDRNIKLKDLESIGFEATSGLQEFSNEFHSNLDNTEVKDVDDVLNSFKITINTYKEKNLDRESSEALKSTASIVSFTSENDEHIVVCNNGILSENSEKLELMERNNIFILYPLDYINNKDLVEKVNNKFNMNYIVDEEKDVKGLMKYIMDIFQEISSNSKYVSSYCHIGVLATEWKEDYRYYILDNTGKSILKALNEGRQISLEELNITLEELNKKLVEMRDEDLIDYRESDSLTNINLTEEGKSMIEGLI